MRVAPDPTSPTFEVKPRISMSLSIRSLLAVLFIFLLLAVAACMPTPTPEPVPETSTPIIQHVVATLAETPELVAFPTAPQDTPTLPPATGTAIPVPTGIRPSAAAPLVQVLSPTNNLQVSVHQTVYVIATGVSENGIARMELSADGVLVRTETAPTPVPAYPAVMSWIPTQIGNHLLRVVAFDSNGVASTPEDITISVIPDGRRPVAMIMFPIGIPQVELGGLLQVHAAALDETGVVQLDLWADNVLYTYTSSEKPEGQSILTTTFTWSPTTPGNHTLFVRARDTQDQTTDSAPLKVFVANTHNPAVSVTLDRTNALAGEPITVTVLAADIAGIQRVELWTGREISATFTSASPARQTYLTAQFPWLSGNPGDYALSARAYNANGNMKEFPAQIVSILRPGQATPTRANVPTPTRTRTPRPTVTPSLQPPSAPSAEIVQPSDHFANQYPVRIVFSGKGNTELDRVEVWGYYSNQLNPQLICTLDSHATTQKAGQCDWSPPESGTVYLFSQAIDVYHQVGRSPLISGYISIPSPPTLTPTPASLAGRWAATVGTNQYVATLRPVGAAVRGDFRITFSNPPSDVAGRIPSGAIKGDRVTFHVEFSPATPATGTASPDTQTVVPTAPPTSAPSLAPALDFDCGVDSTATTLDCKFRDSRGQSGAAQFRRQ